ncbi:MAG: UvrB/UvrC motif-containing protein [Gemmatimonadales bacterium]|nr:UvrB/UvrC motif-containing protein [Gemmatimonadales bacterium]
MAEPKQRCKQCGERDAVFHLHQVVGDQTVVLHLCERCAAERGYETAQSVQQTPLGSFLAAMGKGLGGVATAPSGSRCPGCGASLQDFRESGKLGCSECYVTFASPLRELLRRLHGATVHVGEAYLAPLEPPEAAGAAPAERVGAATGAVEALRAQLAQAIATENFELAAELRDRLRGAEGWT